MYTGILKNVDFSHTKFERNSVVCEHLYACTPIFPDKKDLILKQGQADQIGLLQYQINF